MSAETIERLIAEMRELVRDAGGSITKLTVTKWADRLTALQTESASPEQQAPTLGAIAPLPLNSDQEFAAKTWAADDRLWTTQDTVEFNLRTFARVVLKYASSAPALAQQFLDRLEKHAEKYLAGPDYWRFKEVIDWARIDFAAFSAPAPSHRVWKVIEADDRVREIAAVVYTRDGSAVVQLAPALAHQEFVAHCGYDAKGILQRLVDEVPNRLTVPEAVALRNVLGNAAALK